MASNKLQTAVFEGIKVAYQSFGSGPEALVFVHGWTCDSSLWYKQQPLFHRHRSLLIDLPGHGSSDAPEVRYSKELFARSVHAVLQVAGVTKAVLVAHSMGGPVSTMLLRLFPQLVAGIIYVDSFFHSPETYMSQLERRELAERLQENAKFEALINSFFTEKPPPDLRAKVLQTMLGTDKRVRINAVTTDSLPHSFGRQEVFDIPALLIAGPEKAKIDPHWLHHVPRMKISIWEGHGHFMFMEDPKRFNDEVEEFLSEHRLLGGQI